MSRVTWMLLLSSLLLFASCGGGASGEKDEYGDAPDSYDDAYEKVRATIRQIDKNRPLGKVYKKTVKVGKSFIKAAVLL